MKQSIYVLLVISFASLALGGHWFSHELKVVPGQKASFNVINIDATINVEVVPSKISLLNLAVWHADKKAPSVFKAEFIGQETISGRLTDKYACFTTIIASVPVKSVEYMFTAQLVGGQNVKLDNNGRRFSTAVIPDFNAWASLKSDIVDLINKTYSGPILLRLAWHDAGTYDQVSKTGGPRASMRFEPESGYGANAGLSIARNLLQPLKNKYPDVSYADLWQFAGVTAVETLQGPVIPFSAGRIDATSPDQCAPDGRLPDPAKGANHLRWVFTTKMNMTDQEIVALSGAHNLGRCHVDRSGYEGPWTGRPNQFTGDYYTLLRIPNFWILKNSPAGNPQYYDQSGSLMMLPTDMALMTDPKFKIFVDRYADDVDIFFNEFAAAFQKLSELGWEGRLTPIQ